MDNQQNYQQQTPQQPTPQQPTPQQPSKVKAFFADLKLVFKNYPWQMVFVIVLVLLLSTPFSCGGCLGCLGCTACLAGADESISNQGSDVGEAQNTSGGDVGTVSTSEGKLGDYGVKILSSRILNDYEGNPAIAVTFEFTNDSDEAASFGWSLSYSAYQGGVGLDTAIISYDDDSFAPDSVFTEIKDGATIPVEVAFKLRDNTSPVEIEVSELISFDDSKLTKIFTIA